MEAFLQHFYGIETTEEDSDFGNLAIPSQNLNVVFI